MIAQTAPPRARGSFDWDHLHFYVGNAKQAAHYYATAFGFRIVGYAGPETGAIGRASYVLAQGEIRFVVTSSLGKDDPIAEHVRRHGDGIVDIALGVADTRTVYANAVANGATGVTESAMPFIGVWIKPGQMALMRSLRAPKGSAAALTNPSTPCFVAV